MDNRKQILSHIERINNLSKTPFALESSPKYQKLHVNSLTSNSPKRYPSKSPERTTASSVSRTSRIPSKQSSNHSSRHNSPARFQSPSSRSSNFRELALRTIQELIKLRGQKLKTSLEFVAKEVKTIKKLKSLIESEVRTRKIPLQTPAIKKIEGQIQIIMKESAEELLLLEQKCIKLAEENHHLKSELDQMFDSIPNVLKAKKPKDLNEYLEEYSSKSQPTLPTEVTRNQNYLIKIDHISKILIDSLETQTENDTNLPNKLSNMILQEKTIMAKSFEENKQMIAYEKNLRLQLEDKIKVFEKN
ncbi:hypothetical protein SteCoe_23372 [Stentor coeruleus]|uniref:Uncharacterized protein n=1 Tax=Stentor coeruleus TaxID=5963 RepID=A0A1R2BK47_9CILI|nr:hypothetical protein SteCoe_23372 [Stentor coeruleus]